MSSLKTILLGIVAVGAVGCVQSGIEVDWAVTLDGSEVTCTDVNGADVRVTSYNETTSEQFSDRFACGAYNGTTQELTGGTYTVTVDLLDPQNATLDSQVLTNVNVDDGGLTKLPLIEFNFVSAPPTAQFGYAWSITTVAGFAGHLRGGRVCLPSWPLAPARPSTIPSTAPCWPRTAACGLPGSYTLSASLVNDNGTPTDMTDDLVIDQISQMASLTAGGVIVDVPTFAFVVP